MELVATFSSASGAQSACGVALLSSKLAPGRSAGDGGLLNTFCFRFVHKLADALSVCNRKTFKMLPDSQC